jgi:hypothetical protein
MLDEGHYFKLTHIEE